MTKRRITVEQLTGLSSYQHAFFVIEYCKDQDAPRAAEVCGYEPTTGHKLLKRDDIKEAINGVLARRMQQSDIDAEWLLYELVDNHMIARTKGNLAASNSALREIAKHKAVDAYSAEKVVIESHEVVKNRLLRARDRTGDKTEITFI